MPDVLLPTRGDLADIDILTGHRVTDYRYELTDIQGNALGAFDDIVGGSLDWRSTASIKGEGTLNWVQRSDVDWLDKLIRVWASVEPVGGRGRIEWGLGLWLPTVPVTTYRDGRGFGPLSVKSREAILADSIITEPLTIAADTVVTTAVKTIIESAGQPSGAITTSEAVLVAPRSWAPGTSLLKIINELLDSINYRSLWSDGVGQYRVEPYTRPSARPRAWNFTGDSARRIYAEGYSREQNLAGVPNVAISEPEGSSEGLGYTGRARNDDPASRFSTVARQREIGGAAPINTATSQETADALTARWLGLQTNATSWVEFEHAPIPMTIQEGMGFQALEAGIDALHVVSHTTLRLNPTVLAKTRAQEVVLDA